jgi:formylglycine-generating enzyme required for sulfatase activity
MRRLAAGIVAAAVVGCSRTEARQGGLVVRMSTDPVVQPDALEVHVGSVDGKVAYLDAGIRAGIVFPTTLAIDSNGDPEASVVIDLAVWGHGARLDARHYRVDHVPTDRIAELEVVFRAECASAESADGCAVGETCAPDVGGCASDGIDGRCLPAPGQPARACVAGLPDAGPTCLPSSMRCNGNTPETCSSSDEWQDASPCDDADTHCQEGRCVALPPSCRGGPLGADFRCGRGSTDCCEALEVPGGTFERAVDGEAGSPATISPFLLDTYEVTVGRFRQFVAAVIAGWRPGAGAGKHLHLNGGQGLLDVGDAGPAFEPGWDPSWDAEFATTLSDWYSNLQCHPPYATWPAGPDPPSEGLPINCVSWPEAYAFCIWDGGFLPSEAEWASAAAGGAAQRLYPWGAADPGDASDRAVYGCYFGGGSGPGTCKGMNNVAPVGLAAGGQARWGQRDLAGNLAEWTLDWLGPYVAPCADCASLSGGAQRVVRGGGFDTDTASLRAATRPDPSHQPHYAAFRFADVGFRCARAL